MNWKQVIQTIKPYDDMNYKIKLEQYKLALKKNDKESIKELEEWFEKNYPEMC